MTDFFRCDEEVMGLAHDWEAARTAQLDADIAAIQPGPDFETKFALLHLLFECDKAAMLGTELPRYMLADIPDYADAPAEEIEHESDAELLARVEAEIEKELEGLKGWKRWNRERELWMSDG